MFWMLIWGVKRKYPPLHVPSPFLVVVTFIMTRWEYTRKENKKIPISRVPLLLVFYTVVISSKSSRSLIAPLYSCETTIIIDVDGSQRPNLSNGETGHRKAPFILNSSLDHLKCLMDCLNVFLITFLFIWTRK